MQIASHTIFAAAKFESPRAESDDGSRRSTIDHNGSWSRAAIARNWSRRRILAARKKEAALPGDDATPATSLTPTGCCIQGCEGPTPATTLGFPEFQFQFHNKRQATARPPRFHRLMPPKIASWSPRLRPRQQVWKVSNWEGVKLSETFQA